MEKVKGQILEYLERENIQVIRFCGIENGIIPFSEPINLIIKIEDQDLEKWKYFISRVNYFINNELSGENKKRKSRKKTTKIFNEDIVACKFNNGELIFTINNTRDLKDNDKKREFINISLYGILMGLQNKYYTVCPKINHIYIMCKVTHRCNLDCKYCYDKEHRNDIKCDMNIEVLDKTLDLVSRYAQTATLTFHGGEPTMVGKEWYERVYNEIIPKYPMLSMAYRMQSNGVVWNEGWIDLFNKFNIKPGLSYNAKYQEKLRVSNQLNDDEEKDKRISDKVLGVIQSDLFKGGIIDVISRENYKSLIETYEFYKANGCKVSLTPCYRSTDAEKNELELSVEEYVAEYKKFFKYWLYDKNGVTESIAERILRIVTGIPHAQCEYNGCFTRPSICVEPTGTIALCGRHWPEEYLFGSIFDYDNFEDIFNSQGYKLYFDETKKRIKKCETTCDYFDVCHGGCTVMNIAYTKTCSEPAKELCILLKEQFRATYEVLRNVDVLRDDLNPAAKEVLVKNGFYSPKEIKKILEEVGINISLEYDPDNIMNCTEYQVFKGVNYKQFKDRYNRYVDIIESHDEEIIERNEKARKRDLINYFILAAKDAN